MLAAKVKFKPGTDIQVAVDAINVMERELKERVPNLTWSFIAPDVND